MTTFDTETLRKLKLKISLPVLLVIVAAAWKGDDGIIYWLDGFFLSDADAAEIQEEVKAAAEVATATSMMLFDYIRRQELKDAMLNLDGLNDALQQTLLWESQNGENEISQARIEDIEDRIDAQVDYIECLETGALDCDL